LFECNFIENVHHGILLQLNTSQISGITGIGVIDIKGKIWKMTRKMS